MDPEKDIEKAPREQDMVQALLEKVATLRREKADLALLLEATVEHSDDDTPHATESETRVRPDPPRES